MVVSLWCNIGFSVMLYLAGLQAISPDILEAADMDGATGLKKITRIILPNLKQTYILTGINATVTALKVFVEPSVMTNGGPGTATIVLYQYIYTTAFKYYDLGYAAAMAFPAERADPDRFHDQLHDQQQKGLSHEKENRSESHSFHRAAVIAVLFVIPIVYCFCTSLKTSSEILTQGTFLPHNITWENYEYVFARGSQYLTYYWNTIVITFWGVLITVLFASLGGYAFAKLPFPGSNAVMVFILFVVTFPLAALMIPYTSWSSS